MATLKEEVDSAITDFWAKDWKISEVSVLDTEVPNPDKMGYSDAKRIQATYLYTDMVDSSTLAALASEEDIAHVISAFLKIAVRVIRKGDGHVRSFDGDRVMGIFAGPDRKNRAVRAALRIHKAIDLVLDQDVQLKVDALRDNQWHVKSMTGVASGQALLVRAGIRNNSDLISIGVAPNLAAKLSDLRDMTTHRIAVGSATWSGLNQSNLYSDGDMMWAGEYTLKMGGGSYGYYRSNYHQKEI